MAAARLPLLCSAAWLVAACATAPPPTPAPAPPPAPLVEADPCAEGVSDADRKAITKRHLALREALAARKPELARAFYDEGALIVGHGVVGPIEGMAVNAVDNAHRAHLSLGPLTNSQFGMVSGRCSGRYVVTGQYTVLLDGRFQQQLYSMVWIKTDGDWKVLLHHVEAPRP